MTVERAVLVFAAAGLCASLAGCGSSPAEPAAEPADSPPTRVRPAGTVATIGIDPEGMIYDRRSKSLAVGLRQPYRLTFVDPGKLFIKRQVPLPAPARHLAISPDGKRVVVPAESADVVLQIPPGSAPELETRTGEHPHDATSAQGKIFVADEFGDTVSVIRGDRVTATLGAPEQPGGIAAAGNRYVALVTVAERVLQVYDARTGETLGGTSAGDGPTHIETAGKDAYVADTDGDLIRKFRIAPDPRQVATAPAAGAPYGIAIDRRRKRLWVTLTATNQLAGYSIRGSRPRRVVTYPTIRQPNSVAVDPVSGHVFVASRSNGKLERISPEDGR